ncbi:MAG: hypothetical protein NC489_43700, partial [Ruminococcus flavefaciens]|nr:hypothetical protein [Ruminococcus flavefaciens]
LSQAMPAGQIMPVPARGAGFVSEAVWHCPTGSGYREDARIELIFDGPDPVTVNGLLITCEIADLAGGEGK